MPCWEQPQPNAATEVMDTLKGAALIGTLLGFIATCAHMDSHLGLRPGRRRSSLFAAKPIAHA